MTPGNHGVRRLRRFRSLPPTTNGHGYDYDDASGRTTSDGAGAVASTTSWARDAEPPAGKRFLSFQLQLPTSTEELCGLLLLFVLLEIWLYQDCFVIGSNCHCWMVQPA